MFKWFRKIGIKKRRSKILDRIRSECSHKKCIFLGRGQWTRRSPLGMGVSHSDDTYEGDIFKCKKCGKVGRFNIIHLQHYFSIYKDKAGIHISTTTNMVTGEKVQRVS